MLLQWLVMSYLLIYAVTPVSPLALVAVPAQVSLTAGQSIARFVFQLNGTNLYTDDVSHLYFTVSGADAHWYTADISIEVSITTGIVL